ncbi:MAG: hypothetical protein KDI51_04630 [Xanthomonadales bacterium]|nr:hypothetical protein [Xanthomonadales bacterium]
MTAMMWFDQLLHLALHLGLLVILYVGVVQAIGWRHRPLRSPPRTVAGEQLRVYEGRYKGRIQDIQLEFEVPDTIQFTLRREGWFDRLAKAIGLVSETQLGEAKLDRTLYLELPGSLLQLNRAEPTALTWILGLDKRLRVQGARLLSLQASKGRLKLRALIVPARQSVDPLILSCVQWLEVPLAALRQLGSGQHPESPWPIVNRLIGWTWLIALAGGIALLHFGHAHIVDLGRLALAALILATLLTITGFIWLSHHYDLSSTRHRLLLSLAFIGWPTLWGASALLLRQINISLDPHPPSVTALADSELQLVQRRRIQDRYALAFETVDGRTRRIDVGLFQTLSWLSRWDTQTGDRLQLQQHQGALGIAWRQVAERAESESP